MRNIEALSAQVRQQSGKVTMQRLAIWEALEHATTHPTAEDLFAQLKPHLPTLSLATLYNVLNELVEWGDVRRFDTGDGRIHFDPDTHPHAELICMRCHSVVDAPTLNDRKDADLRHAVHFEEIAGYRIITRTEQYVGFCPDCRHALGEHVQLAAEGQ